MHFKRWSFVVILWSDYGTYGGGGGRLDESGETDGEDSGGGGRDRKCEGQRRKNGSSRLECSEWSYIWKGVLFNTVYNLGRVKRFKAVAINPKRPATPIR